MANSLTYNAVDLGGASYGFTIEENAFALASPPPRVYRNGLANADGEVSQGATFGARVAAVRGTVAAASHSALQTARQNIVNALAAGQEGNKALSFDDVAAGKQWSAKVIGVSFENETASTLDLSIIFYASQPWPVATTETATADTAVSAGGTTL